MTVLEQRRAAGRRSGDPREQLWIDVPFVKAPTTATGDLELTGYASTWTLDRDEEMVSPQAFEKSLSDYLSKNPIVLWQHNMDWPLGSVTSGYTDDTGLYVTALIPNPGPDAADWQKGAYGSVKNGVVRTFSIGGYMTRDVKPGPEGPIFIIAEVDLFEISVVSIPANADSIYEAAVKALNGERPDMSRKAIAQMEQLLGFKRPSDPELAAMPPEAREERYDALAALFRSTYDAEPPGYGDWRRIAQAIDAGADARKVAEAAVAIKDAFYAPKPSDRKAGRAISAANRAALEGALSSHGEIEKHMVDAAESMKAAAAAHGSAVDAIQGVLGQGQPDPDADEQEDEPPSSPEKAAGAKADPDAPSEGDSYEPEAYSRDPGESVQCPECERYDMPDAQFCDQCGANLVEAITGYGPEPYSRGDGEDTLCPECDSYNDADARFCDQCGAKMEGRPDVTRRAAPGGERKAPQPLVDPSGGSPAAPADVEDEAIEPVEDEELLLAAAEYQRDLAESIRYYGQTGLEVKGALPLASLPIADRERPWDASAAKGRVHGKAERDGGGYDPSVLSKAYLWRDNGAPADQATSYRFIVADLVGGELTYVPRGIFAAANVAVGGRGGTSDEISSAIKPAIEKLYSRLRSKFGDDSITVPWAND